MTPVTAAVSAVVFRNEDNGYTVLRCDGADKKGFSAVGSMPDVLRGETLEMTGEWSTHKQYGEQFTVAEYKRYAPTGSDAIYSFLSSGAIRGVGQGLAKAIVVKFGERTFEVIEESPERLSEIRGITPKLAREIAVEMRRTAGLRRLSEFLSKFEVTALVCARLYREYGTESEAAVRENPYILLAPEVGGKFRSAELLRESLGFPADTPERIEAAVLYEMRHNLPNGHVFIPADALVEATAVFLRGRGDAESVGADAVAEAIVGMCEEGIIVREEIGGDDACYLPEMHAAETYIAETLRSARTPAEGGTADDAVNVDVDALIAELEAREGVLYAELQREAVRAAAKSRVTVLTGGPGTGKTTSLRAILALYDKMGLQTLLCAPTGRAAKRMSELCGRDGAVTLHRALGASMSDGGETAFEKCEDDPLEYGAVVVDESSMVDLLLMHALCRALPSGCRLLLIGDENQLPSIGAGNVLADVIRSGAVPVIALTEIFRQADGSGIVSAAHSVNRGEEPDFSAKSGDIFFMKRRTAQSVAETVAELVTKRLPDNMGIPSAQIQTLSPTRRGEAGTAKLNERLQEALNPKTEGAAELNRGSFALRSGDRIMQTRNNYDIEWTDGRGGGAGVFNGDLGTVASINFASDTVTAVFEDRIVEYAFSQLDDIELSYAMTVHKSQGSEYRAVVLALPPGIPRLAVRSLLYTAVTRARELLVIVGDEGTLSDMIRNNKRRRRFSGLRARLSDADA